MSNKNHCETLAKRLTENLNSETFLINEKFYNGSKSKTTPSGWLYVTDSNEPNHVRYILGEPKEHNALLIGLNPNNGIPQKTDSSMQYAVEKILRSKPKYQDIGWIVINLYPWRSKAVPGTFEYLSEEYYQHNLEVIRSLKEACHGTRTLDLIWAAWGDSIELSSYFVFTMMSIIHEFGGEEWEDKWKSSGELTKKGHPVHPSYLSRKRCNKRPFKRFDIANYVNLMKRRYPNIAL